MYRSHTCGELRITDANKEVTLAGWVQTVRKFGAITFVDLRDRYGITQLLLSESLNAVLDANPLGREFVIQAKGKVNERSNKNANIPTGDVEVLVSEFTILNKSVTAYLVWISLILRVNSPCRPFSLSVAVYIP